MTDFAKLREATEKATPGPWAVRPEKYDSWGVIRAPRSADEPDMPGRVITVVQGWWLLSEEDLARYRRDGTDPGDNDCQFIATARNEVPAILTALDEARADAARLREALAWKHTHTHQKGGKYQHIGTGRLQTSGPLKDMQSMEIYRGEDGKLWVRPSTEFNDGRFTNQALEVTK